MAAEHTPLANFIQFVTERLRAAPEIGENAWLKGRVPDGHPALYVCFQLAGPSSDSRVSGGVSILTFAPDTLAVEVLNTLERHKITSVVVVGDDHKVLGVVHLHDLWRTEMI